MNGRGASSAPPIRRSLVGILLALVATACSGSPSETTTAAPTPADELAAAAATLGAASSYSVTITRDGPALEVDALPGLGVEAVSGVFVSPDRAQGLASARLGPIGAEVEFVAIDDTVWLAVPLMGWQELAAGDAIDLPSILGPDGLAHFVAEDTSEVVFEEVEDGPGAYRATFDTTRLSEVSLGVVGAGVTALRGTVGTDGMLASVVFADPVETDLTWRFEFADPGSGDELAIQPPA